MIRDLDELAEAAALYDRSLSLSERERQADEESFDQHYSALIQAEEEAGR